MALKIFNSLLKEKELFKPLRENEVSMYVCGMTVYDYCHIGHARLMVVFDMVASYLRHLGYNLRYVQNITDIDDKIIQRAIDNKEDYSQLAQRFINAMQEDLLKLNIAPPDQQPKATDYVEQMQTMISSLLDKNIAYVAENGDVMYSVSKFKDYGKLSHRNLEDLRAGARIEINQAKQDPLDFVLWKKAKPGEPSWPSPWGEGRPGWHIECSTMVTTCLHNHIDIHGGGMDLKFPHHENELAQAEACTGEKFVNTWMHVGFLQIDNEKMSKSLGNFFLLRDALQKFSAEQLRYFMLSSHYRRPLNYSEENLQHAQEALERFYTCLRDIDFLNAVAPENTTYEQAFKAAMDDDFNTPEALAVLFSLVKEINKVKLNDISQAAGLGALLVQLANVLGLLSSDVNDFFQQLDNQQSIDEAMITELIEKRNAARAVKNWSEADKIRLQLESLNIVLEDGANGTTWKLIKN